MTPRGTAALFTVLALAGCATPVPTVDYHMLVTAPAGDYGVPYQLTDSRLVIGVVPPASGRDPAPPISLEPAVVECDAGGCYAAGGALAIASRCVWRRRSCRPPSAARC